MLCKVHFKWLNQHINQARLELWQATVISLASGQDLEGRLGIAALKNFLEINFLKRYLIASHLLKLHHHLKPVSHGGQKPLTWCAF